MASSFKFNATRFQKAMNDFEQGIREAAETAMQKVVKQAATDARAIKQWRDPGEHTQVYPNGDEWTWTVTGMAAASIQGYVVPKKNLAKLPTVWTTSYRNGHPLQHPHYTNDSVTGDYSADDTKVIGIITMNVAYAPYLQDWEMEGGGAPVTVEVLEFNWDRVYVPIVRREMEKHMGRIARRYT